MKVLVLLLVAALSFGCASGVKKEIAHEKDSMSSMQSREVMVEKMRSILDKSENLSEKQKDQFIDLHGEIIGKNQSLNEDISKLKVILFKELAANKYNARKVNELGRQIKKLHNKKMDNMLGALSKAKKILGVEVKSLYGEEWFQHHYKF